MPAISTNAEAAAAPVIGKAYKIGAGNSMMLLVSKTGIKSWRLEFRLPGRPRNAISLGRFPKVTYEQACILRQFAMELLEAGKSTDAVRSLIWQLFNRKDAKMIPIKPTGEKFTFITGNTLDGKELDLSKLDIVEDFSTLTADEMEFAANCLKYCAYEKRLREKLESD